MNLTFIRVLSLLLASTLISACGGGSGGQNESLVSPPSQNQESNDEESEPPPLPDNNSEPTPVPSFDYNAILIEEVDLTQPRASLATSLTDPSSTIRIESSGFPNQITSLSSDSFTMSTLDEIEQYFVLSIDPNTGLIEVKVNRQFDYETDPNYFVLTLQLGSETKTIDIQLYDIQKGTSDEPIALSSFEELKSYFSGSFENNQDEFVIVDLEKNTSTTQNIDDLYLVIDSDIDATETDVTPWESVNFKGTLNGQNHVIKNLTLKNSHSFISNFGTEIELDMNIRSLGFVNTILTAPIIFSYSEASVINNVFVEGLVRPTSGAPFSFAPFMKRGNFDNIYANLHIDMSNISSQSKTMEVSGLLHTRILASLGNAYANGLMKTTPDFAVRSNFAGLLAHAFGSAPSADLSVFYSAMSFDVSQEQGLRGPTPINQRPLIAVGGLMSHNKQIPSGNPKNTNYRWHFITDRQNSTRIQEAGNAMRDSNNDGTPDIDVFNGFSQKDLSGAGMTEAEIKDVSQFSGPWNNSNFDLTDGEYPVLKNMPYPHEEGASWMQASDPGVAYQRATYDDYLSDPSSNN